MPEKCLVSENNTWTLNENIFQLAVLLFHKTNNSPTKPLSLLLIHIFWNEILMLHHKMFKNLFNSRTQNRFGSFYWKLSAFYSVQKTGPVLRNQTISVELLKYLSDNFACLIFSYLWSGDVDVRGLIYILKNEMHIFPFAEITSWMLIHQQSSERKQFKSRREKKWR